LEMTSSSLLEMGDSAISRCPAFPPPPGDSLCWTSPAAPGRQGAKPAGARPRQPRACLPSHT
jgi:hypothetical protein